MIAAKVSIAIGFPCIEAFDAAMPKLAEAGIPVILLGVQAEGITEEREKNGWKLLRLAPRNSDEADAIAGYLATAWRSVNFGIIDDGTLYGRQLAEAVRFALENDNLKPVFTDTYRPQLQNQISLVRRLRKAGAAYVFIGGDAFDAAIIGKDAKAVDVPLTLAGGSALIAPPADGTLADETLLAALPDWLDREPARVLAKKLEKNPVAGDGYVVPAHAAVEIALTGMAARNDSGHIAIEPLIGKTFDTALGPVRFDENGDLIRNLYEVFIVRDGRLEPVDSDSNTGAIR
jgi:branched-chain amino acid transport system substrate-binding protein